MNILVAADAKWGIGKKGQLLVKIPADQKRFREMTTGKIVVMGRKTFESLPGQTGLYGRTNLVLTKNKKYKAKMADVVYSFEEAKQYLQKCMERGYRSEDIFIIGGQAIYQLFLPLCDTIYLTRLDYVYDADTYFPDLTQKSEWKQVDISEEQTYFDLEYYFEEYRKELVVD